MRELPYTIKIPLSAVIRNNSLVYCLASHHAQNRRELQRYAVDFAFKNDEREFGKKLLEDKDNYWLFRCNQKKFCGDFIIVDMSSPAIERRQVWGVDLKQNSNLKFGGGAGIQFKNLDIAINQLASRLDIISEDTELLKITGDQELVLKYLRNL